MVSEFSAVCGIKSVSLAFYSLHLYLVLLRSMYVYKIRKDFLNLPGILCISVLLRVSLVIPHNVFLFPCQDARNS